MSRRRADRIKILGVVFLAVLSVLAVSAAAANAEGELQIEGKALEEGKKASYEGTAGVEKTLVPGSGLTIECKEGKITGELENLTIGKTRHLHGRRHTMWHFCTVVGNKFCQIYPTEADRNAKTNAGLLLKSDLILRLLRKHLNGTRLHLLRLSPLPGLGYLARWWYTAGGGCTLPSSETQLKGSSAVKLVNATTEEVEHSVEDLSKEEEESFNKELKEKGEETIGLFYGSEAAEVDEGNGKIHLTGEFLGKKWSLN